jgi:5-methylcytosine-specific restriction protein A
VGKLSTLKPRLGGLGHRFGSAPQTEAERTAHRDASQPYRRWYKTARWQKLRAKVLLRDKYTCQRTGVILAGKHPAPDSPVVDHIRPHRGNEAMFWDENNLMAVSKAFHDSQKQSAEAKDIKGVWY